MVISESAAGGPVLVQTRCRVVGVGGELPVAVTTVRIQRHFGNRNSSVKKTCGRVEV
jgi:hypothetical protein